jgi:hypothetical protein
VESYAPGHSIFVSSGRWRVSLRHQIDDLRLAVDWLKEFHRQARIEHWIWDDDAFDRWVEKPLTGYERIFGLSEGEKALFAETRRRGRELVGASLPVVWMHYDFGPWNLYRTEHDFMVIDWEFGRNWEGSRFGPALYDLLYFVTYWTNAVKHLHNEKTQLDGFYRLFIEPDYRDPHTKMVYQAIEDYTSALGMNRLFLPLMLVYMWVEQALHQFDRRHAIGEKQADARLGNLCVRYISVLAKHTERLFARS